MVNKPADGYLLLADISGFVEFLAGEEVGQAPALLEELFDRRSESSPCRQTEQASVCHVAGNTYISPTDFLQTLRIGLVLLDRF